MFYVLRWPFCCCPIALIYDYVCVCVRARIHAHFKQFKECVSAQGLCRLGALSTYFYYYLTCFKFYFIIVVGSALQKS